MAKYDWRAHPDKREITIENPYTGKTPRKVDPGLKPVSNRKSFQVPASYSVNQGGKVKRLFNGVLRRLLRG